MKLRKWEDVMKEKYKKKYEERKAEIEKWVFQQSLEMLLAELRKESGLTQEESAARLGDIQNEVLKFERGDSRLVSMLRKYVEALGGKLEVVAVFGHKSIRLRGV